MRRGDPLQPRKVVYPTYHKWPATRRQDRLILLVEQAVFSLSGVCGPADAWNWADRAANPPLPGLVAKFFSAADRPVLRLSCSFDRTHGHAHSGGARNRRKAANIARTVGPVTATSASWKVMAQIGYNFMVGDVPIYTNLRGYYEFDVQNRTEGGSVFLTINLPVSALAQRTK